MIRSYYCFEYDLLKINMLFSTGWIRVNAVQNNMIYPIGWKVKSKSTNVKIWEPLIITAMFETQWLQHGGKKTIISLKISTLSQAFKTKKLLPIYIKKTQEIVFN